MDKEYENQIDSYIESLRIGIKTGNLEMDFLTIHIKFLEKQKTFLKNQIESSQICLDSATRQIKNRKE